jgi:hypothetical protein
MSKNKTHKRIPHDAQTILDSLAVAFGGRSQVPDEVVGAAIFGRANNAPTAWPREAAQGLLDDCAAGVSGYWEGSAWAEVAGRMVEAYRAARARCESTHAPEL